MTTVGGKFLVSFSCAFVVSKVGINLFGERGSNEMLPVGTNSGFLATAYVVLNHFSFFGPSII